MLAAGWLTLCGFDVSWSLEPCGYDLLATSAKGQVRRVQVKKTRNREAGTWKVWLSTTGGGPGRATYDPDDVDYFFVLDGDLGCYLVPLAAVGGLHVVHFRAYERFRLTSKFDPGCRAALSARAGPRRRQVQAVSRVSCAAEARPDRRHVRSSWPEPVPQARISAVSSGQITARGTGPRR